MTIPNKVKIGGFVYSVEKTEHISMGWDYAGEILYRDLKINIRPADEARMNQAFLHEIVHGIYDHLGFKEHDEEKVDMLAGALHTLIVDNPGLFDNNGLATKSFENS